MRLLFILAFCFPALADELTRPKFETSIFVGSTLGPKTKYKYSLSNLDISPKSESDRESFTYKIDLTMRFSDTLGAFIEIGSADYAFKDGSKRDQMIFAGVGPKNEVFLNEKTIFYSGISIGVLRNQIGETSSSDQTTEIVVTNPIATGFSYSPRVGVEYAAFSDAKLKFELAYHESRLHHNVEARSVPGGAVFSSGPVDLVRSFFTVSIGLSGGF